MRKRTLVSKLRDVSGVCKKVKEQDLVLVAGGIKTITQNEDGEVVIVEGDTGS